MSLIQVDYDRYILKNGGRFDLWLTDAVRIANFLGEHKIQAVDPEHLPAIDPGQRISLERAQLPGRIPFPGGIRCAHLHLGPDVFLLDAEQWRGFSRETLEGLSERIGRANTVGFQQLMELNEAVGALG